MADAKQVWTTIISVDIDNTYLKDIGLFLKMPDGTIAQVKDNFEFVQFSSLNPVGLSYIQKFNVRAPMGINALGDWEVIACNHSNSEYTAQFHGAKMQVYGFDNLETLQ